MSVLRRLVIVFFVVVYGFGPLAWLILTSLKTRSDIIASPPRVRFSPTLQNFSFEYYGESVLALATNSVLIALGSSLVAVALGVPAGYYFSRVRTRIAEQAFIFVLSTRILSPVALSVPYVFLFSSLGLRGSHLGVILCHTAFNLSLVVWIAERFYARLDRRVELAGLLDGASPGRVFRDVVLPQSTPMIVLCLAIAFIFSWNEFAIASVMTSSVSRPLTTALPSFVTQGVTQWGKFSAAALISLVPVIVVLLVSLPTVTRISPSFLVQTKG